MSIGSVNQVLDELRAAGLCESGKVTDKGYAELEPFQVRKAVILAAGFGDRPIPITLNTP